MPKIYILSDVHPQTQMYPRAASGDKETFDAHVQKFLSEFKSFEEVSSESIGFGQYFEKVYKAKGKLGTHYYGVSWVWEVL